MKFTRFSKRSYQSKGLLLNKKTTVSAEIRKQVRFRKFIEKKSSILRKNKSRPSEKDMSAGYLESQLTASNSNCYRKQNFTIIPPQAHYEDILQNTVKSDIHFSSLSPILQEIPSPARSESLPEQVQVYVQQTLDFYLLRESIYTPALMNSHLTPLYVQKMRTLEWIITVSSRFNFTLQTIFLASNIVNRVFSKATIHVKRIPMLAVVSLFIACKFQQVVAPKLDALMSLSQVHLEDRTILVKMEFKILELLDYNINYISPLKFIDLFTLKLQLSREVCESAYSLAKKTLFLGELCGCHSSQVGLSCIYLALEQSEQQLPDAFIEQYELAPCLQSLRKELECPWEFSSQSPQSQ